MFQLVENGLNLVTHEPSMDNSVYFPLHITVKHTTLSMQHALYSYRKWQYY